MLIDGLEVDHCAPAAAGYAIIAAPHPLYGELDCVAAFAKASLDTSA
jgi:hypothetical protein